MPNLGLIAEDETDADALRVIAQRIVPRLAALLTDLARKPTPARVPHAVASPKEALEKLSRDGGKKPRYSTNDNAKLAAKLDLTLARKACPSLEAFCAFVEQLEAPA